MSIFIILISLLILSFLQVSIISFPFGMGFLAVWYWLYGNKNLILITLGFTLILSILSDIPSYLVLLSFSLALFFIFLGRSLLPSQRISNFVLILGSLIIWEVSLATFLKLV